MIVDIVMFCLGLVLIVAGGNFFVDASVWAAEKLRVPKFIIGATVVSLATTLPELLVSVLAAAGGKYEMAAGNAIGSVVANTGLILAIGIVAMPCESKRTGLMIKSLMLLGVIAVTFLFSLGGTLGYAPAALLLLIWVGFMALNLVDGKKAEELAPSLHTPVTFKDIAIDLLKFGLGTAGLVFGSRLLVGNGADIAASLGVPEGIIAVTIVAVGTSLPELVTAITAICKKQTSLSVGNIIGANITDMAFIVPICAYIAGGLPVKAQTLWLDLPVALVLTALAFTLPAARKKYSRPIGIALLAIYVAYLAAIIVFFG